MNANLLNNLIEKKHWTVCVITDPTVKIFTSQKLTYGKYSKLSSNRTNFPHSRKLNPKNLLNI